MIITTKKFLNLVDNYFAQDKIGIVEELCDTLNNHDWRNTTVDAMRNFTEHKMEHSYRVLQRILQLDKNAKGCNINYTRLNQEEVFILTISSLLHDICMTGHPKSTSDMGIMDYFDDLYKPNVNFDNYPSIAFEYTKEQQQQIRKFHAYFAQAKIKLAHDNSKHYLHSIIKKITDDDLEQICTIIKFHTSLECVSEIPRISSRRINVHFLTMLFRIADELDLGNERDIEHARKQGMDEEARAYWEMDYRMNVEINSSNYIVVKFKAQKDDIITHGKIFDKVVEKHIVKNEELVNRLHEYHLGVLYKKFDTFTEIDDKKESILPATITCFKNFINYKSKTEQENERIAFLEANIYDGFKLDKSYMGVIIPRIGDKYKIYVYKEFTLLRPNDYIKCKVHINNRKKLEISSLTKQKLKLLVYLSYRSENDEFKNFIKCENVEEICVGEEYLHFKVYFKENQRGTYYHFPIKDNDTIAIFYTYEVCCAHYGNELVRKSNVFPKSELACELAFPKENEHYYDFKFNERNEAIILDNIEENSDRLQQSILYRIQKNVAFNGLLNDLFTEQGYEYFYINIKKCLNQRLQRDKKSLQKIYAFVANWDFVPFFTDPKMYLQMERYVNDGSPSEFTRKFNTTENYTPYSMTTDFDVNGFVINETLGKCMDFGNPPNWLNKNEILVHPDKKPMFLGNKNATYTVIPTASSRTVYINEKKCYAKLQYNKIIGRIERVFTPGKIENAITTNAILTEEFDKSDFPSDLFFLPEPFGRIIDFGENFEKIVDFGENFEKKYLTRYLGMVLRDYSPYPKRNTIDSQKRLVPAFSLFAKENGGCISKSIIELLYEFNKSQEDFQTFILEKVIKPIFKVYFELLLRTGLHIEGHAQNILYLISINKSTIDINGVIIRDFESFDKDINIMKQTQTYEKFANLTEKTNNSLNPDYMKRNSFLFDFKLGEYLVTPILNFCQNIKNKNFDKKFVIAEIKRFNAGYIKQLPNNFYPRKKWYSYKKVLIDRSGNDRPWIENQSPKYR